MRMFEQPGYFYLIFFTELWERFGYYGLQVVLMAYLVNVLGLPESDSIDLFSSFSALVCSFVPIGGWLGDRILGAKRAMILGALVLTTGYSVMALSDRRIFWTYLGMSVIAVGSGLFKANPSSLLSSCYDRDDPGLDGVFTMYYMSINVGSLLSMVITPWLMVRHGWNVAFSVSVLGMIVMLINFVHFRDSVRRYGSSPDFAPVSWKDLTLVIIGILFMILASMWLLRNPDMMQMLMCLLTASIVLVIVYEVHKFDEFCRRRMMAASIMMAEAMIFFTLYNQIPTSLNFFATRNVRRTIFGVRVEPEQLQALNPFWIVIASPLLTRVYNRSERRSTPLRFAIGMMLCSLSFLVLPIGTRFADDGTISAHWLVLSYALQGVGELMISGLGLSMISQLVPKRLTGFMMGAWFLTTAMSSVIAGLIANLSALPTDVCEDLHRSLRLYSRNFTKIGVVTGMISLVMLFLVPKLDLFLQDKNDCYPSEVQKLADLSDHPDQRTNR